MPHLQRLEGRLDAQRHACNVAVALLQLCPALHHVHGEWTHEQGRAVAPIPRLQSALHKQLLDMRLHGLLEASPQTAHP